MTKKLFSNKSMLQTEAAITRTFWSPLDNVNICVANFINIYTY